MAFGKNKTLVSFGIENDLDERLEKLAEKTGKSKSMLINEMIRMNLDTVEKVYSLIEGKASASDLIQIMYHTAKRSNEEIKNARDALKTEKGYADGEEQLKLKLDRQ